MKLVLLVIAVGSLVVSAYRSDMKSKAESISDAEAENLNEAALGQLVAYNSLLAEKVETLKQELETSNRNLAELQSGSEAEDNVDSEEASGSARVSCCLRLWSTSPTRGPPQHLDKKGKGESCKLKKGVCSVRISAMKEMKKVFKKDQLRINPTCELC